jgi:hypothetical protein
MHILFWGLILFDIVLTAIFFFVFREHLEIGDRFLKRDEANIISGVLATLIFITVPSLVGLWVFGWRQIFSVFS